MAVDIGSVITLIGQVWNCYKEFKNAEKTFKGYKNTFDDLNNYQKFLQPYQCVTDQLPMDALISLGEFQTSLIAVFDLMHAIPKFVKNEWNQRFGLKVVQMKKKKL